MFFMTHSVYRYPVRSVKLEMTLISLSNNFLAVQTFGVSNSNYLRNLNAAERIRPACEASFCMVSDQ